MFDVIFTHDERVLNKYENSNLFPIGGCWVGMDDKQFIKHKSISIISSSKTQTIGHNLRHEIIKKYSHIDVYGGGYTYIDTKEVALDEYIFSIVIENVQSCYYFSEKLIDCIVSKTIPIYYGASILPKEFDVNGIIIFNTIEEFDCIMNNIDSIKIDNTILEHNRTVALKYCIPEERLIKELMRYDNI
jgi:hypothetical protein